MMNKGKPTEYEITLLSSGSLEERCLRCASGRSILSVLQQQGIMMDFNCGGRGTCGKCRLRVLEGQLGISSEDRRYFSETALEQGWRLACRAFPAGNCRLLLPEEESEYEIITEYRQAVCTEGEQSEEKYAIAADIGTTTIALSLIGVKSGRTLWTYSAVNSQRAYGADVISRIHASNTGKQEELRECIRKDLLKGISESLIESKISETDIERIVIAGNTTMGHLLLGYSCEGLGRYPYTPVNIGTIELPFGEVFGTEIITAPVTVLPGFSAFAGGDITAGLLACGFDKAEQPCLFLDLGTNGEMAVGNKDRILVSSTAAGPAFEGGNISCGTGSIAGAICGIELKEQRVNYQTIGNNPPVGICGTGMIELSSELLKAGLIDETGLLLGQYFEDGFRLVKNSDGSEIVFTQKDIRELQLAKAAVRAGTEILINRYGINYEDIDRVYLAGGFGYRLNIDKALHIGLLAKEFTGKVIPVGNTALGGAVNYITDETAPLRTAHLIRSASEINLSEDPSFQQLFPEYMYF